MSGTIIWNTCPNFIKYCEHYGIPESVRGLIFGISTAISYLNFWHRYAFDADNHTVWISD